MLTAVTKEMRTARNVFIFSLALSDFLLALTIPATVYDAVTASWQMSFNVNICRFESYGVRYLLVLDTGVIYLYNEKLLR